MRTRIAAVLALRVLAAATVARAQQFLVPEGRIVLPRVARRIDHMAVDLARRRLFVAAYGNNTLDVIDLAAGTRMRRIRGLDEPQGVGYSTRADVVAVANGGDGTVRLYRGSDLSPAGWVALGRDADNIRVDPRNGDFIVAHGAGGLAIIDPNQRAKIGDIKLPAHPESFQIDDKTGLIFANVPDAGEIAVIDLAAEKQVARWTVPGLRDNFPMALDDTGRLLAVVFWHPPKLVLLDPRNGAVRAELDTCGDADDAYFDRRRGRIYVSCGAGMVDVFERDAARSYSKLPSVETASGARTSLFVPRLDRLFVAVPAGFFGGDAAIIVFRPQP